MHKRAKICGSVYVQYATCNTDAGCFEEELSNGCDDRVVVVTIFYETKNTYK